MVCPTKWQRVSNNVNYFKINLIHYDIFFIKKNNNELISTDFQRHKMALLLTFMINIPPVRGEVLRMAKLDDLKFVNGLYSVPFSTSNIFGFFKKKIFFFWKIKVNFKNSTKKKQRLNFLTTKQVRLIRPEKSQSQWNSLTM